MNTAEFEINFVDRLPPNRQQQRKGKWAEALEPLKGKPGKWAKVRSWPADENGYRNCYQAALALERGKYTGVDEGEFSTAIRQNAGDENFPPSTDLYVKFTGGKKKTAKPWGKAEVALLFDESLSNTDIAGMTGRSRKAVWDKRYKIRLAKEETKIEGSPTPTRPDWNPFATTVPVSGD